MYSKILVPVDGSATSELGLAEAIRLGRLCSSRLLLLHVVDMLSFSSHPNAGLGITPEVFDLLHEGGKQILAKARAQVEAAGLPVETQMVEGFAQRVCDAVVEAASKNDAQLIVLGTHGRRGIGRALLGSDAELILRQAPVPVLLVRSPVKA
ncbi:universal stress protein [Pelomonas sp. SE-A7]|uniref:universal stress protein n=1 Tax=Pelomonas sp. SE-A7 TaxID=3054953 RepID=UPI00259CE10E|nr:universal stress protein [Pelomonas sp. SE-A7]MDM4766118.1 universal stress protein [Pelomonas sp. SE-A7]